MKWFEFGFNLIQWIFWITLFKVYHTETERDWWGFLEKRINIINIELFWLQLYIDYILDYERIIEVE